MDNIKIVLNEVDFDFTDYDDYAYIPSGYKILKAEFTFENVGKTSTSISYRDFDCYADGFSCDTFYYVDGYNFTEYLMPEKTYTASVYFEIPEETNSIEIEYDSNKYSDGKIIFNIENDS